MSRAPIGRLVAKLDPGNVAVKIEGVGLNPQGGPVVLLAPANGGGDADKVLPIFIDQGQAMNIQLALEGQIAPRPMTHDLFSQVLNELGAIVEKVVIEELAQNTFYASLYIQVEKGEKASVKRFDARPSDCLALAVRVNAPIHVSAQLLEKAGVKRADIGAIPDSEEGDADVGVSR